MCREAKDDANTFDAQYMQCCAVMVAGRLVEAWSPARLGEDYYWNLETPALVQFVSAARVTGIQ